MAAPLIAGNDVTNMTQATQDILLNTEIIAVDQDPLGQQGTKVWDNGSGLQVYSRVLQGTNTRAVALINTTTSQATIQVTWTQIGIPAGAADVRDLWAQTDLGPFTGSYSASVDPHGVVMLRIAP